MKTRICAVALIEKDGKFLMGKKLKDVGPYPNTWNLPGGGVEENESLEDAIKREVMEETGLEVTRVENVGYLEDEEPNKHGEMTHYEFHIFKVSVSGDENVTDEFPELIWVDKTKLNEVPLARPTIEFFKQKGLL